MTMQEKFHFTIYKSPVRITMAVDGRARFLREQAFLDQFLGRIPVYFNGKLKVDENYYILEDDQFVAYLKFRRQMDAEFGAQ